MIKTIRLAKFEEAEDILKVYQSGGDFLPYTDIKEVKKSIKGNHQVMSQVQ